MTFTANLICLALIFSIVACGFNILVGYSGLFSVAQAGLFGVGAYTFGIAEIRWHASGWVALILAIVVATAVGGVVGVPAFRVRGDYLVAASFGVEIVLSDLFGNLSLTGGQTGLAVPASLGGQLFGDAGRPVEFIPLAAIAALVAYVVCWGLVRSRTGLLMRANRADERVAASLGKRTPVVKVLSFTIAGAFAGLGGALYSSYILYLNPGGFGLTETIVILAMVLVGGAGTVLGPLLGSVFIVAVPALIQLIPMPLSVKANVEGLFYGVALLLVVLFRPNGIIGKGAADTEGTEVR